MSEHLAPRVRTLALVFAALLAFGSLPATVQAQQTQQLTVVKVGGIPVDTAANVYDAIDQGYFKEVGLDVQVTPMNSGPAIAAAVAGGAVDIGVANVVTVAAARERGIPIRYIAPCSIATPTLMTDVIMVRKDSGITGAAQLNKKIIAINGLKDLQQISASTWLDKHGGDSKTVQFIEVPFPEMGADAIMPTEPFTSADEKNGGLILGDVLDGVAPRFMILGWFATDSWLQSHADVGAKFASAIAKASAWANTHHAETAEILAHHTKVPLAVAQTMHRAVYGTALDPAMLQPVIDAGVKYAIVPKPLAAAELIWHASQ
jgi:NitT/TauT family transport system substrate-binding protein